MFPKNFFSLFYQKVDLPRKIRASVNTSTKNIKILWFWVLNSSTTRRFSLTVWAKKRKTEFSYFVIFRSAKVCYCSFWFNKHCNSIETQKQGNKKPAEVFSLSNWACDNIDNPTLHPLLSGKIYCSLNGNLIPYSLSLTRFLIFIKYKLLFL